MSPPSPADRIQADLAALEASVNRAGAALACAFSSSAEFEAAVIRARRARGALAPWYIVHMRLVLTMTAVALAGLLAVLLV